MLFSENFRYQSTEQLKELRKELLKYAEKWHGLSPEALESVDYATSLIENDDFAHFDFSVLVKESEYAIDTYFERAEAEDALIEYWEEKFLSKKKPNRKILKGIPDRGNQPQE